MAYYCFLIWLCVYMVLVIAMITARRVCDERKCRRAPLTHYTSLHCTPEYTTDYGCCPVRYNCDHLYERYSSRLKKCYINGYEYMIGSNLTKHDSILCEGDCTCKHKNGIADFVCKTRKECSPYQRSRPDCYQQNPLQECCATKEICINDTEVITECWVFSKGMFSSYLAGEYIRAPPGNITICEGNRNSTNKVFPKIPSSIELRRWSDIHAAAGFYKNCAPVYLLDKQGSIGLRTETWRCEKSGDYVLHRPRARHDILKVILCDRPSLSIYHDRHNHLSRLLCRALNPSGSVTTTYKKYRELCKFGQKGMHINDVLNRIPYGNNSCIVCSCEVPPVPTCVIHQDKPCDQYMHCTEKDIINGKCT